jgi:hypothetical protein
VIESPDIEPVTAWHPMLVALLEHYLPAERLRGKFAEVSGGLWRGEIAGMTLHGVETAEACQASPSEHLLYAFSRAFTTAPREFPSLDAEEHQVYSLLYQQVEQFRRSRGDMAVRDFEALTKSYDEATASFLATVPAKQRLAGLSAEEVAQAIEVAATRLSVEQIAKAVEAATTRLSPAEREELKKKLS